jgi:hypothetical protein
MKWVCALLLLIAVGNREALAAEKPDLWLYYPTNLLVDKNIDTLQSVWTRAAAAGYSHVLLADSKFARLDALGDISQRYFANIARVKRIAADLKLQIVPALFSIGYSNDLLFHDPNLAEGLPVKDALFVVHDGKARIVADPPVSLVKMSWKDDAFVVDYGVATVANNPGNARLNWQLSVSPFRCYHVSVWIKSDHFTGRQQIEALANNDSLQYENIAFKATQDWTKCDVVFNSLNHQKVNLYIGIWGAAHGTLSCKDWKIEEAGLTNVLRRPGAPCIVRGETGAVFSEGKDYDAIADPKLGNEPYNGEYEAWHDSPAIVTHLPEGTRLRISWFHPEIIYDGQVPICFDEPKTQQLLSDQARLMKQAWGSAGYMMSHDEIRVMGWDESCLAKDETPGKLLADNARFCTDLLRGSDVYVWSDMFDPFHNARKNYYLVNGDLIGSWEGLDKSATIVNWNFEKRDNSLKFFADRGHRQVIAGYYDGDVHQIKDWLASAAKVQGVVGVMYTTWENKYSNLEAFADEVRR